MTPRETTTSDSGAAAAGTAVAHRQVAVVTAAASRRAETGMTDLRGGGEAELSAAARAMTAHEARACGAGPQSSSCRPTPLLDEVSAP
ncbi:hypothetical protein GCM10010423_58800 [Streptomyces levis]|uniref:Uncharacterized protein n=1 Tax=Streptomyces levis TaxID=285566 RepID=A0ABN3NZE3_9ACTN